MVKKSRNPRTYRRSQFFCKECGHMLPLHRQYGKLREYGHIKDLWCIKCQKTTKHEEERVF